MLSFMFLLPVLAFHNEHLLFPPNVILPNILSHDLYELDKLSNQKYMPNYSNFKIYVLAKHDTAVGLLE